ncbi:MAG TPA: response regulator [Burkholderiaceae bacterium]|nr:response regulator [Burkholderiaceae bacterium]
MLIVDDNRDAADSLAMLIGLLSYEPRVAYDGESGMEIANWFRPDIAILDISMPRMSGYELAQRLRHELAADAPVLVALTALSSEEDRKAAREAGFEHHLAKPVDSASLCRLVIRILSERAH